MATKKVFISYSHDSKEHMAWVRELASQLVLNGIEVLLDQWHLKEGGNLGLFMEQALAKSDYTLLICTPNFAYKVNNRVGGVAYETDLIVGNFLIRPEFISKYIPVLRNGLPSESIPNYLYSRLFIDFHNDQNYHDALETLLRRIFDAPLYVPPKLGTIPAFAFKENKGHRIEKSPMAKILVAGLGVVGHLTGNIIKISEDLGKKLAVNHYGLVTGGWPGVDEIVARSFSDELLKMDLPLENYLTQVIVKTILPTYTGGKLILIDRGEREWKEPILACDAIVLVNGIGGTYETGKYGLEYKKPVFPIADSGGDALKMYMDILMSWEDYSEIYVEKLQFQRLGGPLNYSLDGLISILNSRFPELKNE